jgi:hypothetical protein
VPTQFITDLLELMPHEVTLQPTVQDFKGARSLTGSAQTVPAHVVGQHKVVRTASGQEKVSTVHAILGGVFGATIWHKYTLPSAFAPVVPPALSVETYTEEDGEGPSYEIVYF